MNRPSWTAIGIVTILALSATDSRAQFRGGGGGLAPGSTPPGDILRGEGVMLMGEGMFLQGAGMYDYYNAMGNSINTDTWIRLNDYIFTSVRQASMREEKKLAARIAKNRENYKELQDRILNHPEYYDLKGGNALNSVFRELTSPQITETSFRLSPVQITGENIRNIPFVYAPRAATISMQRFTARGKWPVAFRSDQFAADRRAYERAIDNALEQQREGKITPTAIDDVEKAVNELSLTLDRVIPPSRDPVYLEARNYLTRLEKMKELFKYQKVELILGEIDKYAGTTVKDLVDFMKTHSLQFGVPDDIGDEQKLYNRLFASLRQQLDLVRIPTAEARN